MRFYELVENRFEPFDDVSEQPGHDVLGKPVRRFSYKIDGNEVCHAEHNDRTTYVKVDPAHRGKGYGKAMLGHLASIGKKWGDPTNQEAVNMFKSAGWTKQPNGRYLAPGAQNES